MTLSKSLTKLDAKQQITTFDCNCDSRHNAHNGVLCENIRIK